MSAGVPNELEVPGIDAESLGLYITAAGKRAGVAHPDETIDMLRFEIAYGNWIISLIPQESVPSLMALNIRPAGKGLGASAQHFILRAEELRAMFNFLGVWLHKGGA